NVTVSFACTDATSGLASGSPPAPTTLSAEGANQSVSGTCTDNAGNSASATFSGINIDKTAPTLSGFSINGGAPKTTSTSVTLTSIAATDAGGSGVAQMSFSNDGTTWSAWQPYASSASWTLTTGDGSKTVSTRVQDAAGNISTVRTATITLDTTAASEYGVSINQGALFTNTTAVTLTLAARAGTAEMQVSNDGGFVGAQWEPYSAQKAWQITQFGSYVIPRVVYARFRDAAGNVAGPVSDDIILDVTPPSG